MPLGQFLWRDWLAAVLLVAQVDNQRVTPFPRGRVDAVLATAKLADGSPGARRKVGGVKLVVAGHVGAQACPCGLVVGVHAQAGPYIGVDLVGLFLREGIGDPEVGVRHGYGSGKGRGMEGGCVGNKGRVEYP